MPQRLGHDLLFGLKLHLPAQMQPLASATALLNKMATGGLNPSLRGLHHLDKSRSGKALLRLCNLDLNLLTRGTLRHKSDASAIVAPDRVPTTSQLAKV
jgi:hypothetical protein